MFTWCLCWKKRCLFGVISSAAYNYSTTWTPFSVLQSLFFKIKESFLQHRSLLDNYQYHRLTGANVSKYYITHEPPPLLLWEKIQSDTWIRAAANSEHLLMPLGEKTLQHVCQIKADLTENLKGKRFQLMNIFYLYSFSFSFEHQIELIWIWLAIPWPD